MSEKVGWYTFLGLITCLFVLGVAVIFFVIISDKSESKSISANDVSRICIFTKTDVMCIYPDGRLSNGQ